MLGTPRSMQISRTTLLHTSQPELWDPALQHRAFVWMYRRCLRSCRLMGAFVNSPLPPVPASSSCAARPLRSADVTPLPRYYEPSRHRLAFGPTSRWMPVIRPILLRRFLGGARTISPVARHALVTVLSLTTPPECRAASVRLRRAMLPSPQTRKLGLRGFLFRGHLAFTSVTAR